MKYYYKEPGLHGEILLHTGEAVFESLFYQRDRKDKYLTIAWNRGEEQKMVIDTVEFDFPSNAVMPLMMNQSFRFSKPTDIVAWQFNREFYCIVDHDSELGCVGFLFYGSADQMFIKLDEEEQHRIYLLLQVFIDEMTGCDCIKDEMLKVLLKRLIIKITRLAKEQYIDQGGLSNGKLDILRNYNLLVENNYKNEHQVKFYARQLHKSPKTLSNLFLLYNNKSPLEVIQARIILEAKRLFQYTNKSSKEIAEELGFNNPSHFSRFFKSKSGISPTEFKALFDKKETTLQG